MDSVSVWQGLVETPKTPGPGLGSLGMNLAQGHLGSLGMSYSSGKNGIAIT